MKNTKFNYIIYIAIIFAIVIAVLFFYINKYTNDLLEQNTYIINDISKLKEIDYKLNQEIIRSSSTLYHNYDNIHKYLANLYTMLDSIEKKDNLVRLGYSDTIKELESYKKLVSKKDKNIQKFLTLNSIIKNSSLYIPTMLLRYVEQDGGKAADNYLFEIASMTSSIFLAKNTLDTDFILDYMKNKKDFLIKLKNPKKKDFNTVFKSHVNVFLKYFKVFVHNYKLVLESQTNDKLNEVQEIFINESDNSKKRIQAIYIIVMMAFIFSIITIIYLLFVSDKAIFRMKLLQKELENQVRTDLLTCLSNRNAYEQDIKNIENPILYVIGIKDFSRINELYGNLAGDSILLEISTILKQLSVILDCHGSIYCFESNKFGILFNQKHLNQSFHEVAVDFIYAIESHCYKYRTSEIFLTIDIGVSQEKPLLEKALMVLNHLKHDMHMKCLIYSKELQLAEEIEKKFIMNGKIRKALENKNVIPFYQPIYNNGSNKIEKYECLARLLDEDNHIIQPDKFLSIAIESRQYTQITRQMVEKCFDFFSSNNYEFTLNLSMIDVEDAYTRSFIIKELNKFPDIAHRVTFEIVETEGFENYALLQQFSNQIREYGARIAIDDFGSGYSNFTQILGLKADYLKIDASLIKNIDKEIESEILVKAIVDFSKKLNIKTLIAEHVDRPEVLAKVKELGIGYSQGFYFGKPQDNIEL